MYQVSIFLVMVHYLFYSRVVCSESLSISLVIIPLMGQLDEHFVSARSHWLRRLIAGMVQQQVVVC